MTFHRGFRYSEFSLVTEDGTITVAAAGADEAWRKIQERLDRGEFDDGATVAYGSTPEEAVIELAMARELTVYTHGGDVWTMAHPHDPDSNVTDAVVMRAGARGHGAYVL